MIANTFNDDTTTLRRRLKANKLKLDLKKLSDICIHMLKQVLNVSFLSFYNVIILSIKRFYVLYTIYLRQHFLDQKKQ